MLQQCEHYQTALENERAQVKLQQQTNVQLQQTLNEATNPEQLQKQEASSKLQEYETRMRRYREECDQARVSTRALKVQISRLQGTVNDLIRQSQAQAAATTDSSGSDKSELEEQCERLRSDNDGLSRQLQRIVEESETKQAQIQQKGADYDVLMQRFTELQQICATLENELGPLREEREAIFRENAQLKESSQPEKYAKLKEEHALLLQQCEHYQTALENERAQVKLQQQTNVQLQQTLNEATNPEQLQKQEASSKLQEYETRMRRYREERDQARVSTRALEVQISRLQGTVNDLIRQSQAQAAATTDSSGSDKSELEEQCERLRSDNDGLSRQLQRIVEESETKQAQIQQKGADYDVLMQRFTELQQICATLENELGPLREEREAIFRENAQLKESSQPEKYAKLKEEHALLLQQCEHYQTALENERAQVKLQQQTNVQLQQTLNEATNPEQLQKQEASSKLQEYETRMRRYREERDLARSSARSFEVQLNTLQSTVNDVIHQSQAQAAVNIDSSGPDRPSSQLSGTDDPEMFSTNVRTKRGVAEMLIQKPTVPLNYKNKGVIVKRQSEDSYETGRLMFVGSIGGKETAGIQLDVQSKLLHVCTLFYKSRRITVCFCFNLY